MRHVPGLLVLLAVPVILALAGCAGMDRRPPPSLDQIVEMSKAGMPPEEIVRELQETRAVYPLTGSQLASLHEQGVPDQVLDYMQNAYVDRVRWESRMSYDGSFGWNCFYCYHRPMIVAPY
ncbi:MAG TPA: hypothetical protein VIU02_11265 [Burkholderiales bacterium]